jgi:uridine monophosphate synthetase
VPGIGAQGGSLEQTLSAGLRDDGIGLVVNISRAIAQAENPREQARCWRDKINRWRVPHETKTIASPISELATNLITTGCVRFGEFKLKSGIVSPIYLDLRRLISHPHAMRRVARAYADILDHLQFDRLAGIPYAGLPIATAVALETNRPLIYARREVKEYGTRAAIEGEFAPGETIAVIDDLATTGDTKIEAVQKLTGAGLIVRDIIVLIDREQGARAMLQEHAYHLHAVATLTQLLDEWQRSHAITPQQFAEAKAFLASQ